MRRDDGVRAGLRIVHAWAQDHLPARQRVTIVLEAAGSAVVAAAGIFLLVGLDPSEAAGARIALALCGGVSVGSLVALVAVLLATRSTTMPEERQRFTGLGPVAPTVNPAIRDAWLRGQVPDVDVNQRWAAAETARDVRRGLPRGAVLELALLPFWLGGVGIAVAIGVTSPGSVIVPLLVPFWALLSAGRALGWLRTLGRTASAIETAPEEPENYVPPGRKITKPYKQLGTDHPDDYT